MSPAAPVSVRVGERTLRLTHLEKVLYPQTGTTKADVIGYATAIADVLLPQLRDRPVTRKRWPDGSRDRCSSRRTCLAGTRTGCARPPSTTATAAAVGRPATSSTCSPTSRPPGSARAARGAGAAHAAVAGGSGRWAAFARPARHRPGSGCARRAGRVRRGRGRGEGAARRCRSRAVPVLSGSKGIHLYADLMPAAPEHAAQVAQVLAQALADQLPGLVVPTMARQERAGRVYVDWSQNNPAKTTITRTRCEAGTARP